MAKVSSLETIKQNKMLRKIICQSQDDHLDVVELYGFSDVSLKQETFL